ncbi:hypothetical protein RB599_006916 [Gaeumannomyces hyphopodioides]
MSHGTSSTSDVLLYLLAVLVPPVPVFLARGCGADFLINIGLTILGWIPGMIRKFYLSAILFPAASHVPQPREQHADSGNPDAWWIIAKQDPAKKGVKRY